MSDTFTRVLLIRHGINDYVKSGRLAGRLPGVHLNEEGQAQALALAQRLLAAPLAAIYSSPLERAQETATPLAEQRGLAVQPLPEVLESDCGEWAGQAVADLRETDLWRQIQVCPSITRFPGGENAAEIQARMVAAIEKLRILHPGQTIAVVSHADPIKLALAFYIGLPLDLYQRLEIGPASISELALMPWRPVMVRLNDCAHVPPHPEETTHQQTVTA